MSTKTARTGFNANSKTEGTIRSTMNSVVQSKPVHDIIESAREYARENPEAAALWCFGIGFVLAWKLKPW